MVLLIHEGEGKQTHIIKYNFLFSKRNVIYFVRKIYNTKCLLESLVFYSNFNYTVITYQRLFQKKTY